MNILLVGDYPDDPRLGSAKVYHKLREEFLALGHECRWLTAADLGARPARPRLRWAAAPALAARAIARELRERGPCDVVDAASAEGLVFGLRRRLGAQRGVALVSRSHGLEHLNYRRMLDDARAGLARKPWTRRLWYPAARLSQVAGAARVADRLLVLNEGDREFAVRRGWKHPDRVDVVPHGVSARFLESAPPPGLPRGRGVLFCGTWDPVKGVGYLAEAFALLAHRSPGARLTVLGGGVPEARVLESFPAELRAAVTVLPRSDEEEVMRHYREHDVLVLPSTYEGFGMVVVEAMSQRLPVVATPVGCTPSLLGSGEGGVLVPPRDPAALAGALERLLADPALRERMGRAAHDAVRGMTWRRTAERTLEVYERALARARGGR